MQRSSIQIPDVNLHKSTEAVNEPRTGQRSLHTVIHDHYSIARESPKSELAKDYSEPSNSPKSSSTNIPERGTYKGSRHSATPGVGYQKNFPYRPGKVLGSKGPENCKIQQEAYRMQQEEYQQRLRQYEQPKRQTEEYNRQVQEHNKYVRKNNAAIKWRAEKAAAEQAAEQELPGYYQNRNKLVESIPYQGLDYPEMMYRAQPLPENKNPRHHEKNR